MPLGFVLVFIMLELNRPGARKHTIILQRTENAVFPLNLEEKNQ